MGLRLAIGLLAMAAGRTGAAGVLRVHEDDGHPSRLRLVGEEGSQLSKGPGGERRPGTHEVGGWLSRPYPLANMRQVFQRYRPLCVFGSGDNLFADAVVNVALKARLLAAALLQEPL